MIKLIGALTMLIDHIGAILLPQIRILRIIGRVSMPFFAYCIARGFYYSEKKGTTSKYIKNMLIFSIISQIPFSFVPYIFGRGNFSFIDINLNIGFTWLFSLLILKAISYIKKPDPDNLYIKNKILAGLMIAAILLFSIFCKIKNDYGLYGILFPLVFYYFMFKTDTPLFCFFSTIFLYIIYALVYKMPVFKENVQIFSIFSVFLIMLVKPQDDLIKLPRRFFYVFYPLHLAILLFIAWWIYIKI